MRITRYLLKLGAVLVAGFTLACQGQMLTSSGFLYHEFPLTLAPGERSELLGPLFSWQKSGSAAEHRYTPLFSIIRDPELDSTEYDFAYPILTYDRYGKEHRWQFFQLLSTAGGDSVTDDGTRRITIFPFYFQQRSPDTNKNYTALIPIHGRLKNRLFRDEVKFTLMPLYVQTRKKDVVTVNLPYPFFHLRHGNGLEGWQFWPVFGHEHKDFTTRIDDFGDEITVPGHDKWMALWPFFFHNNLGIGSENPIRERIFLPLYSVTRSPNRDSTTVLWPFFTWTDDREKKYREYDVPFPLIVFARGEGKTGNRVWPFYSHMKSPTLESSFVLWPLYKFNRADAPPLLRERHRILFFLYSDLMEKNITTGAALHRRDFWPLFTWRRGLDGNERLQVLALLEPFLPASRAIERNYSPVWSLWRSEHNATTGARSQSLLWNLYRRDASEESTKCSLLFGLFQYQRTPEGRRVRVFWLPPGKRKQAEE